MQSFATWERVISYAHGSLAKVVYPRAATSRCKRRRQRVVARCVVTSQSHSDSGVPVHTMPSLPQPRAALLAEIGRRILPAEAASTAAGHDTDQQLVAFACGMSGTPAEVQDPQSCQVEGNLPSWLQGDLYRNGPGTFDIRTDNGKVFSVPHWCAHCRFWARSHL